MASGASSGTMAWPADAPVTIASLAPALHGKVRKVELLGHPGTLKFTQDAQGLKITFPPEQPCDFVYSLKITGLKLA